MVNILLKFIDLFSGLLKSLGVDYDLLRIILWAKLTIDSRKSSEVQRKGKKKRNALTIQVFVYSFLGIFVGTFIALINSPFVSGIYFFTFIMLMIALALISEFTTVLFDTSDNTILLPRPVDSRTILVAKIIHVAVYLMISSLSLSFVSLVVVFVKYGVLSGLVFLVSIFLATIFSIFLTNLFYLGLIKMASGEKLKDIIAYFQVVMVIVFMAAYQLLPRLIDKTKLANMTMDIHWWTFFLPPAWMAGTLDAFANMSFGKNNLIFLVSTILYPLLGLWIVSKFFAPGFNRRLSQSEQGSTKKKALPKIEKKQRLQVWLTTIFTRNPSEAISFIHTWKLSSRDRKFKQSVYPSFGYAFILIVVFLLRGEGGVENMFEDISGSQMFYIFLYSPVIIIFSVLANLRYSEDYQAAWIYKAYPVEKPGNILSGGLKAALVRLFLPIYIIMGMIVVTIWGFEKLPDILLALFNILLFVSLISRLTIFSFPFSEERIIQESGKRFIKDILSLLIAGLIGGIHFLLNYLNVNILWAIPIVFLAMLLIFRSYRLVSWDIMRNA